MNEVLQSLRGGLIVSCQARGANPLTGSEYMAVMAQAAQAGGAAAIRAEGPADITAIRAAVTVPVIGLFKVDYPASPVYITPTAREVRAVLATGAPIVALDATGQKRPGEDLPQLLALIHAAGRLAMADISTLEEALQAEALGFDIVGTTLAGYTPYSRQLVGPDLQLVEQCVARCQCPVIAEGRIGTPQEAARALALGAFAVTVGTAITDPLQITSRFVDALNAIQKPLQ